MHMYKSKNKNVIGQHANTQSQKMISTVQGEVNSSVIRYCTACVALVKLSSHININNDSWQERLLLLEQEDIHPLKYHEEG